MRRLHSDRAVQLREGKDYLELRNSGSDSRVPEFQIELPLTTARDRCCTLLDIVLTAGLIRETNGQVPSGTDEKGAGNENTAVGSRRSVVFRIAPLCVRLGSRPG